MKILSVVEATNVNAVAKLVLDFFVTARELAASCSDFPEVQGSIVTFDRAQEPNDFISAAHAAGIEVDVIPERRRFDLAVLSTLKEVISQRAPEIIVTNSVKSHFLLWRSKLWKHTPWVAFHHGYTTTDRKMQVYNRFDRWSLPKADLVVTVCNAFAHELTAVAGVSPQKIRVQHNSIRPASAPPPEEVRVLRERLRITPDQHVILCVGRFSKEKAQADLIEAFVKLRQTNAGLNCKLLIVGDGPERAPLEAKARETAFADRIIFTGQVADVRPFYAIADVFVLPSHSEGSPNVLLEAMAARVPMVATEVGGIPEIVENETSALLVRAKEPTALAAAIVRLLSDASLRVRLTDAAAELIARNHTPEQYVEALIKLYTDVAIRRS